MRTPPVAVCWVSALTALASPKSATLTRPSSAMRTFSGLMSRWIRPARWALASADRTGSISARARAGGIGLSLRITSRSVWPGDELHREEDGAVVLALVVDGDDVGVREPGGGPGLADEPGRELLVVAEAGVHHLDRDGAVEPEVGGLVDAGHATARHPGRRSGSGRPAAGRSRGRRHRRPRPCGRSDPAATTTLLRTGWGRIRWANRTDRGAPSPPAPAPAWRTPDFRDRPGGARVEP